MSYTYSFYHLVKDDCGFLFLFISFLDDRKIRLPSREEMVKLQLYLCQIVSGTFCHLNFNFFNLRFYFC